MAVVLIIAMWAAAGVAVSLECGRAALVLLIAAFLTARLLSG